MRLFKKVAIVGVGLIGGSLALALKRNKVAGRIVGVSRHRSTISLAKRKRIIDGGSQDLRIIKGADLLMLAMPVEAIIKLAPRIAKIVGRGCIVTDAGSTKGKIVSRLEKIFPFFVGSHPLAGSEKRGAANARADLFRSSLCVVTGTVKTSRSAQIKVKKLWQSVGARVVVMTPSEHDKILSFISHLPHIVAFCLINSIPKAYLPFASGGLRDTTRIAASDSQLWTDICLSNSKNILKALQSYEKKFKRTMVLIRDNESRALTRIFRQAKRAREDLSRYPLS